MNFFYEHLIARKRGSTGFVILLFFLLGFILARLYVYLAVLGLWKDNFTPAFFNSHIHHFALGIFLVAPAGFTSLVLPHNLLPRWRLKLAAVYGLGLGLIFDEFGMWLNLKDEYSLRQGYDAVIIAAAIIINVVYFARIWRLLFRATRFIIFRK